MDQAASDQGVTRTEQADGSLFSGRKLYFCRNVPQREWLAQNARLNGAEIAKMEKFADIILYDQAKKPYPHNVYSYKFVEDSIRRGVLEDLDAHRLSSPSQASQPVGSVTIASKGSRTPFTEADDQLLWNWVYPYKQAGGKWQGNEIYDQLARVNSRHTRQSWRDRFIKYTQYQKRTVTEMVGPAHSQRNPDNLETAEKRSPKRRKVNQEEQRAVEQGSASKSRPTDVPSVENRSMTPARPVTVEVPKSVLRQTTEEVALDSSTRSHRRPSEFSTRSTKPMVVHTSSKNSDAGLRNDANPEVAGLFSTIKFTSGFTMEDALRLYKIAPLILSTAEELVHESWTGMAGDFPAHSAKEWQFFFDLAVRPEFMRQHHLKNDAQLQDYLDNWEVEHENIEQAAEPAEQETETELSKDGGPILNRPEELQRQAELLRARREEEVEVSTQSTNSQRAETIKDQLQEPQTITCSQCFNQKSEKWRWRENKAYCNGCAWWMKAYGAMRPSSHWGEPPAHDVPGHAEAEIAKEPSQQPADNPNHAPVDDNLRHTVDRQSSPTVSEPESPELHPQDLRPNADEGRKRESQSTTTNSNSQSSQAQSQTQQITVELLESVDPAADRNSADVVVAPVTLPQLVNYENHLDHSFEAQSVELHESSSLPLSQKPPQSAQQPHMDSTSTSQKSSTDYETAPDRPRQKSPSFFVSRNHDDDNDEMAELSSHSGIHTDDSQLLTLIADKESQDIDEQDKSSSHPPSEAESEFVPFDTAPDPSQAWKTMPDEDDFESQDTSTASEDRERRRIRSTSLQEYSEDEEDIEVIAQPSWSSSLRHAEGEDNDEDDEESREEREGTETSALDDVLEAVDKIEAATIRVGTPTHESQHDARTIQLSASKMSRTGSNLSSTSTSNLSKGKIPLNDVEMTDIQVKTKSPLRIEQISPAAKNALETQALFEQLPHDLDDISAFDIPPPEGGWGRLGLDDIDELEILETQDAEAIKAAQQTVSPNPRKGQSPAQEEPQGSPVLPASKTSPHRLQQTPTAKAARKLPSATVASTTPRQPSRSALEALVNKELPSDLPPMSPNREAVREDRDQDKELLVSDESDLDNWLAAQQITHSAFFSTMTTDANDGDDLLFAICTTALESTCMKLDTATAVVDHLATQVRAHATIRRKLLSLASDGNNNDADDDDDGVDAKEEFLRTLLPREIKGCWTIKDDSRALSKTPWQIGEVEVKHGEEGVGLRLSFLEEKAKIAFE